MDPTTVIIMIAVHLVGAGALLAAIAWRSDDSAGLWAWSAGAVLMGLAYTGRLLGGLQHQTVLSVSSDVVMLAAPLCVIVGLREFAMLPGLRQRFGAFGAGFAVVHVALAYGAGVQARFVFLNVVMGLVYLLMTFTALDTRRRFGPSDAANAPLAVFALMVGTLGLMTVARGVMVAVEGPGNMYRGLFAAMYYAFGSLVGVMTSLLLIWIVFERLNLRLKRAATHDALTGVYNRHGLRERLDLHFRGGESAPLVLLALDIDHFKRLNDQHGHAAGDAMLRAVATELRAACRAADFVARIGGEEFLIGVATHDAAEAMATAERLRRVAAGVRVTLRAPAVLRCTVSIGASRPIDRLELWEQATGEADRALYAAKAAGRNRTLAYEGLQHTAPVDLAVV